MIRAALTNEHTNKGEPNSGAKIVSCGGEREHQGGRNGREEGRKVGEKNVITARGLGDNAVRVVVLFSSSFVSCLVGFSLCVLSDEPILFAVCSLEGRKTGYFSYAVYRHAHLTTRRS